LTCSKAAASVIGLIFHKEDYKHLRMVFERVKQDQEVLIVLSNKHYKRWAKVFSPFMPKLWVMICSVGVFFDPTPKN